MNLVINKIIKGENRMKNKIICIFAALLLQTAVYAEEPGIYINGNELALENTPFVENGNTMVPLRGIAEKLGYIVIWNDEQKSITVSDGTDELIMYIGDKYCLLNGEKKMLEASVKIVNDSTYVPVRVVTEAFNCDVHWDDYYCNVSISTDIDSPQLLVNYGIIDKDDLNKGGNVTNTEFIELLCSIIKADYDENELRSWYSYPELEPLDNIDDKLKMQLMQLTSYRGALNIDDVLNMDFNADITEAQALVYLTRLLGDTYGCTDAPAEWSFTDISQTYETAARKGLIESSDMTNADKPISRDYLYTILCRAMLTKISVGGYVPSVDRLIDRITSSVYYKAPECEYQKYEINADVSINSDMSVSWTIDESDLPNNRRIRCYSEDGTCLYGIMGGDTGDNFIDSKEVVEMCTKKKPASYIEVSYSEYNTDNTVCVEKSFKIDLSGITRVTKGEPPEPGVYKRRRNTWLLDSVSLKNESFKPGIYYILTSYEHKYRKEEYNSSDKIVITVDKETPLYTYSGDATFGLRYYDDVHLSTAEVTGNPENGFVIYMTPETTATFISTET